MGKDRYDVLTVIVKERKGYCRFVLAAPKWRDLKRQETLPLIGKVGIKPYGEENDHRYVADRVPTMDHDELIALIMALEAGTDGWIDLHGPNSSVEIDMEIQKILDL